MKDILVRREPRRLEELGYGYVDVTHDTYKWVDSRIRSKGKVKTGQKTCRFVQPPDNEKSIIPGILKKLKARKDTEQRLKLQKILSRRRCMTVYVGIQTNSKLVVWTDWSTNKSYLYERYRSKYYRYRT